MSTISHRISTRTKIAKVADPHAARYALGAVHAAPRSAGGAWLTATDGRILAAVGASGVCPTAALIPAVAFDGVTTTKPAEATLNGVWRSRTGKTDDTPEGRFPACDKVVSEETGAVIALRVDAVLLAKLAAALTDVDSESEGRVTLLISRESISDAGNVSGVVRVIGDEENPDAFGVVMPIAAPQKSRNERSAASVLDSWNKLAAEYRTDFAAAK